MYLVSFLIGLIIVISSIFLIRHELNRAIKNQKSMLEQSKIYQDNDLFKLLESLQHSVDEMNRAFYDIASDLEGKYSIHEREINLLNEKIIEVTSMKESKGVAPLKPSAKAVVETMKSNLQTNNREEINIENSEPSDEILIDRIVTLRSEGRTLAQIAKELGIGMGELQLLLTIKK